MKSLFILMMLAFNLNALSAPSRYTDLLDYVQLGPDQGETNTCLFIASTGAMELIANKKNGITNPVPYGPYDLAESYLINAPVHTSGYSFLDTPVLKFNWGFGIHINDWSFEAWNNSYENQTVWNYRNWEGMKKVSVPKVETIRLFQYGGKWSENVLDDSHINQIKDALVKYESPVLVNYVDEGYWHVILIVGYDDDIPGQCYDNPESECSATPLGSFYIRDSFGITVEVRDYDWFRAKGNAAFVVKEAR